MAEEATYKADNYWYAGLIGTLLFHGVLLLIFLLYLFKTPIPPLEPGGGGPGLGIDVNLGSSDFGMGSEAVADLTMPDFVNEKPVNLFSSENYVTQNNSESETISGVTDKNSTTTDKGSNKTDTKVDDKYIYKGKNQGVAGGTGNQGNKNGNLTSTNYNGDGGDGSGGGTGGGHGTGDGPGDGPGTGPGVSTIVKGRLQKNLAKPVYTADDEGKIVVEVKVNPKGIVVYAKALSGSGTTISNSTLKKQCEAAALKSTYEPKSDAAVEQIGTITYTFLKLE